MNKITAACYFYDDSKFCETVLKSIYEHFDSIIILVGANKYTRGHWCCHGNPPDNTVFIIKTFMNTYDKRNKIKFYNTKYFTEDSFGEMKNQGIQLALKDGADWYFEIDAGEIYHEDSLKQVVESARIEKEKMLYVWPFFTFYPDFKTGYRWPAGELRCFKIDKNIKFTENRNQSAILYNGDTKLWPYIAVPKWEEGLHPGHKDYTKQFDFFCYHLDDLKPPINLFHRCLRRVLYKKNKDTPDANDIKQAYEMFNRDVNFKVDNISVKLEEYVGAYPEQLFEDFDLC